jgi:hypothetical protein
MSAATSDESDFLENACRIETKTIVELTRCCFGHRIECLSKQALAKEVLP